MSLSQKESSWSDYPIKKMFQSQYVVKKVILTVFWDMKGPISIDVYEIVATIHIS